MSSNCSGVCTSLIVKSKLQLPCTTEGTCSLNSGGSLILSSGALDFFICFFCCISFCNRLRISDFKEVGNLSEGSCSDLDFIMFFSKLEDFSKIHSSDSLKLKEVCSMFCQSLVCSIDLLLHHNFSFLSLNSFMISDLRRCLRYNFITDISIFKIFIILGYRDR
ncbi:unnamed protein product [Moneuplotes crassus]|uniref:Uncharacterized protein n=1 Tax=Euplotes crassus TaxID=5936 RepID=A0AAD1Y937_EUPCR|nr:unnamed protein product [Moneuplotes crassus]